MTLFWHLPLLFSTCIKSWSFPVLTGFSFGGCQSPPGYTYDCLDLYFYSIFCNLKNMVFKAINFAQKWFMVGWMEATVAHPNMAVGSSSVQGRHLWLTDKHIRQSDNVYTSPGTASVWIKQTGEAREIRVRHAMTAEVVNLSKLVLECCGSKWSLLNRFNLDKKNQRSLLVDF